MDWRCFQICSLSGEFYSDCDFQLATHTGFETQGVDAGTNDFFGSFDGAGEQQASANDAFAAAFDTGAWGDGNAAASDVTPATADFPASDKSDEFVVGSGVNGSEDGGDDRKKDSPDSQRKDRSRRRRPGTSSRSSRANPSDADAADGVEPNPSADSGDAPKKDRRSRRSSNDGNDESRRRSGSRSRRKGRGQRESGRSEGGRTDDGDGDARNPPKKTGSFKGSSSRSGGKHPQAESTQ